MSQPKSGLIPGLIVGLFAMLLCAAGLAAAFMFEDRLPAFTRYGEGAPMAFALCVVTGLVVGLAVRAVRPRSLLLPPLSALFAAGAVFAGVVVGFSLRARPVLNAHEGTAPVSTVDGLVRRLDSTAALFFEPLGQSWKAWVVVAVAALTAFVVVALRVRKVRRASVTEPPVEQHAEPEYRAPFEPAQPTETRPAGDLFTPRNP